MMDRQITHSTPSDQRVLDPQRRTRCEIWTRVMGYHRPVSSFNTGKQGEFHERCFFRESTSADAPAQ